jgi:hypothetical protein
MSNSLLDGLLTDNETAAQLGHCARTLKRWRDLGEGPPFIRISRRIYYRRIAIQEWLLSREVQP